MTPLMQQKLPQSSFLHVGKLVIDGLTEENLPLTRELHLQPLLDKGADLLFGDPVEVGVFQTCLDSLDDHSVAGTIYHMLEVDCAAWP